MSTEGEPTSGAPGTAPASAASTPPSAAPEKQEPIREQEVAKAVRFLQHPRVKTTPISQRTAFLRKKGLTEAEIAAAVERSASAAGGASAAPPARAAPPAAPAIPQPPAPPAPPKRSLAWKVAAGVSAATVGLAGLSWIAHRFAGPEDEGAPASDGDDDSGGEADDDGAESNNVHEPQRNAICPPETVSEEPVERSVVSSARVSALDDIRVSLQSFMEDVRGEVQRVLRDATSRIDDASDIARKRAELDRERSELLSDVRSLIASSRPSTPGADLASEVSALRQVLASPQTPLAASSASDTSGLRAELAEIKQLLVSQSPRPPAAPSASPTPPRQQKGHSDFLRSLPQPTIAHGRSEEGRPGGSRWGSSPATTTTSATRGALTTADLAQQSTPPAHTYSASPAPVASSPVQAPAGQAKARPPLAYGPSPPSIASAPVQAPAGQAEARVTVDSHTSNASSSSGGAPHTAASSVASAAVGREGHSGGSEPGAPRAQETAGSFRSALLKGVGDEPRANVPPSSALECDVVATVTHGTADDDGAPAHAPDCSSDAPLRTKTAADDEDRSADRAAEDEGRASSGGTPPYSADFLEVMRAVKAGETPPDVRVVDDAPDTAATPSAPQRPPARKPWERAPDAARAASVFPTRRPFAGPGGAR